MMVTIDFFFPAIVAALHVAVPGGSISFVITRELHLPTIGANAPPVVKSEEDSMSIGATEVAACFHVFRCRAKKSDFTHGLLQPRLVSERQQRPASSLARASRPRAKSTIVSGDAVHVLIVYPESPISVAVDGVVPCSVGLVLRWRSGRLEVRRSAGTQPGGALR